MGEPTLFPGWLCYSNLWLVALHSCFQPASPSTPHTAPLHMYYVSAQDIDEHIINVHSSSYYYYNAKVPVRTPNHKKFVCVCKAISGNCWCHNNDPHDNIHVMTLFMNDCGSPVPKTSAGNTKLAGSIKVEWKSAQSCVSMGRGEEGGEKQGVCIFCCCWGWREREKQGVKILRSKTAVPLLDLI